MSIANIQQAAVPANIQQAVSALLAPYGLSFGEIARPRVWLTRKEAAAHARISPATIDRAVRSGNLSKTKTMQSDKARVLIDLGELDAWLMGGRPE